MSRIGKMPVIIPAGVEFKLSDDNTVTVKGPKGTLSRKLPDDMNIAVEAGQIVVSRPNDLKRMKAFHGLTRMLIFNMVEGVTNGFSKTLEIVGTGYRAAKNGDKLVLSLGYSHPVEMDDPKGVTSTCETPTRIVVAGIDKEAVGQYAADIRSKRPPEPYKGKGVKYQGEYIIRKAGKAGKK
ncbi:MAG: 50S ribosomal protein L6 [Defluviitaleaceae bacterium]|nr:50S ribosomal protein L6 [Defluviitaleaceae bacterium]MCL2836672.1 50S ribosomal protein L6 [Defluviitaleaceae bacterium]